jgi:hypothetical protein
MRSFEPAQKEGFKDVADTLLDEAKKDKPDPGQVEALGTPAW